MASATILKSLFSSQTRVKLLSTFLLHPEEEYFIRELTRLLGEQINSIRRELENLRHVGLVKARHKNRKKYYRIDPEFLLYKDLQSLFSKVVQGESPLITNLKNIPGMQMLLLAGSFCGTESKVDILAIGNIRKEMLEGILAQDPSMKHVKYSIFSTADFLYRVSLRDRFVMEIINDPRHLTTLNTIAQEIEAAKER